MECVLESLVKKTGLTSNELLKCALINTAIELFSYVADPTYYSTSSYLYQDWSMEDHMYGDPSDAEHILETADTWIPSLPSDRILDQAGLYENLSLVEDVACIPSVEELETMYLPIPENLCETGVVNDRLHSNHSNNLGKPESFYYLVGPVNLWLECPMALDTQATPTPRAEDAHSAEDNFQCCSGKGALFLNASPGPNFATKRKGVVLNDCAVQTTEELLITSEHETGNNSQKESFSVSFNYDTEAKESIFWDSYDLHLSRIPIKCAYSNIGECTDQDNSSIVDDLFKLLEEEMALLAQQDVENLLHTDLYPLCSFTGETYPYKHTKVLEEQPVSSTPCVEKTRRVVQLQNKSKVHVLENLKHRLFN